MGKRTIRIGFEDFWDNFNPRDNFIYNALTERYDIELSDKPDYLFYSVFGDNHLGYDCIRVFYTGENQSPDFNICDYAIGFDSIILGDRYLRYPIYNLYGADFNRMLEKHAVTDKEILDKTGFCCFVASNNLSSPERNLFFEKLSNDYRQVDSGGRFRNNVGGPVADKFEFQSQYKFAIAFENCSQPGYCTEKLIQAFAAKTVPIYWGDPLVTETFNPDSFVNCHDFNSWSEVVERIKQIDNDDELFRKMLHAPALLQSTDSDTLSDFLYHIIGQPLDKATRASRHYWGDRYLMLARERSKAYSMSPRGIAERIYKATIWKYRHSSKLLWKIDRMLKKR